MPFMLPLLAACLDSPEPPLHCSERGLIADDQRGNLVRRDLPCEEWRMPGHRLHGQVIAVDAGRITVHHDAIEGLMPAMTMTFRLPAGEPVPVEEGDWVRAHLVRYGDAYWLLDLERTGRGELLWRSDVEPVRVGERWPGIRGTTADGQPFVQRGPVALAFLYTRCPNPAFCAALVGRLLALQPHLPPGATIVTVSLDPERDSPAVLAAYRDAIGADPTRWIFVHAPRDEVARLAALAGQRVSVDGERIHHEHRLVVLDASGVLVERYDHLHWPLERVVRQLAEGRPAGLHPR